MKVQATALGYYGDKRIREGQVFELIERTIGDKEKRRTITVDQQFSDKWMKKVDQDASVQPRPRVQESVQLEETRPMDRVVTEEAPSKKSPKKKK